MPWAGKSVFVLIVSWFVLLLSHNSAAQTLRERADQLGFLVGTAVRPEQFSEPAYSATLAREYNLIEAENSMKWEALRPSKESFDFAAGDKVVGFAREHRMKVRGHTLVWGRHNPQWLTKGNFDSPQLARLLHQHIETVVEHYRDQVFAWDVLNEAFDENGTLRSSIWYDQPGIGFSDSQTAYIEQIFRWAHSADPHAQLFYNDNGCETLNIKSDAIYKMVRDFKKRNVPIHGIGLQMHIFDLAADVASVSANIKRFTELGIQVHITEMDVALPVDPANGALKNPADLLTQAEIYRAIASACLAHPGCSALQTWGFTDEYSWIRSYSQGKQGSALPFDTKYKPKPAYRALMDSFSHPSPAR